MISWRKEYVRRTRKRYKFFSSCSAQHVFFVTDENRLFGCGGNGNSQLFIRDIGKNTFKVLSPLEIQEFRDIDVKDIQMSWAFSVLLPRNSNIVYYSNDCGLNSQGIVTSCKRITPRIIGSSKYHSCYDYSIVKFQENVVKISVTSNRNGFYILTSSGKVFKKNSKNLSMEEVKVPSGESIFDIVSGDSHTFFVSKSGNIFGMGSNRMGVLFVWGGASKITFQKTQLVIGKVNVVKIQCGYNHTAVLTKEGDVLISGNNMYNQQGSDGTPYSIEASTYQKYSKYDNVTVGGYHNILQRGKDVYSFGYLPYGRLGRSSEPSRCLKVTETHGEFHCGRSQTFIVSDDGIQCAGYADYGTCLNGSTKNHCSKFEMVQKVRVAKFQYVEFDTFRKKVFSNTKYSDVMIFLE